MSRSIAGVFMSVLLISLTASCGSSEMRPNMVLIVIDALRADHLGCYGYHRQTSPTIDSLAEAGMRFDNAQAQAPWTLPSMATIMTGLSVRSHRTMSSVDGLTGLDPRLPSLATELSSEGYATAAFLNCYWCSQKFGFHRGFSMFECIEGGHGRAGITVDNALEWLDRLESGRRFAMVIHIFDPHSPYHPPGEYATLFMETDSGDRFFWDTDKERRILRDPENLERYLNLYDGEIAWVDHNLGRLFGGLRSRGLADSTVVLLTADHGEEFLDHDWIEHSVTLYQEVLHVPMILAGPGIETGKVVSATVGHIDILPTILSLAGADMPEGLEGRSLLSSNIAGRAVPSEGATPDHWRPEGIVDRLTVAVRRGDQKLIYDARDDSAVMYDLDADPGEQLPLAPDSALLEEALYHLASPPVGDPPVLDELDQADIQMIRDLGYF